MHLSQIILLMSLWMQVREKSVEDYKGALKAAGLLH